jgi:putative transposase
MPIPKAQEVKLSNAERQGLEKLVKRRRVGQQIALRARIVLAAADGLKNKEIITKYAVTADTARLWRHRWIKLQDISLDDLSLEDRLQDAPRPGAPARITANQRCQIEALACEKPENSARPISHWSAREIADEIIKRELVSEISPRHAARLLKRGRSQATLEPLLVDSGL